MRCRCSPALPTVQSGTTGPAWRAAGAERGGATRASTTKRGAPAAGSKSAAGAAGGKPATLRFDAGWHEELQGDIVPGGKLRVQYAPERLPDYRGTLNRKATWDIIAMVLFSP